MKKVLALIIFITVIPIVLAQTDTTQPAISSVLASDITKDSTVINWTTDEGATSTVEYGKDTAYGTNVTDSALNTSHRLTLTGLSASTAYHYRAVSKDSSGNEAVSADSMFTTSAAPDTTAPTVGSASPTSVIPNKQVTFSAAVSDNIGVATCLISKDQVNYTAAVSGGTASYTFSSGLPEGSYKIYIECKDAAGNTGTGEIVTATSIKQPLQITVNLPKTTYYPNENLEPKFTVTDASGKIVIDASVSGNITGPKTYYPYFFYSTLCDCYKASYWLSESVLAGEYTLYFDASHKDSQKTTASTTFKVVKPIIQTFALTTDKTEYFPGDSIKLTVTSKDSLGNAITSAYITGEIRDADTGKLVGPIYPNAVGDVYTYTYYLGSESLGKKYQISVSTTWKEQKANSTTTVTVVKRGLNADVALEKNVLSPGESLRGSIKVYDKDGNTIKDAKVIINVQDPQGSFAKPVSVTKYLTATFKDGIYEIEPWTIEDWRAVGNYTLEIKIDKSPEEVKITKSIEITKQKLNVDIFLDRTSYKPGDRMYIKVLVTYPNGTVAKDAWVSAEIFSLIEDPFAKVKESTGAKESYKSAFCRIYPSLVSPIYYKGEFVQKYFLDSPYISSDCLTGKYVLKVKVGDKSYAEAEILKEFDVALAKFFIETGFRADSQVDSVNLAVYAEVKDENDNAVEFSTIEGTLRPTEESKGCTKQFYLYYDNLLKRYTGNQFLSRYECPDGDYIIQLKASSPSYETAEVVQGLSIQYKKGYEYRGVVPATPFGSQCKEVSCGPDCVQRVCEPITTETACLNTVTDEGCIRECTGSLEKAEQTAEKSVPVDLKECVNKCTVKVACQGSAVQTVPVELMIDKLNELKKEVAETKGEVGALKEILLMIIDFINSILSRFTGQQQSITVPSEVIANATTNTTNPVSGAFLTILRAIRG